MNQGMRDTILGRLLRHAFEKQDMDLSVSDKALADDVYDDIYPKDIKKKMATFPDGFLGQDTFSIPVTARRKSDNALLGCGRPSSRLCDYPLVPLEFGKEPKTCDAKLCPRCAVKVGPNADYCPAHARMAAKQEKQNP
jgi:hypothetical protein